MNNVLLNYNADDDLEGFVIPKIRFTSVWIMVLLSVLTFGMYLPYWLLSRRKEINRIAKKVVIKKAIPLFILISYFCSALIFTIGQLLINEIAIMLYEYIDILITYFGVIFIIYYSFKIRLILLKTAEDDEFSISKILTFFFAIFYLQHQINKYYH